VAYLLDATNLGGESNGIASLDLGAAAFGADAYAGGTIYVPTVAGIYALRAGTNSLTRLWHQSAASQSPIVAGPGVWAIGNDTLYQLDPATGDVRYHATIGQSAHFATPSASAGRIFVAANGRILAFG
jgi:outer membrane protein assembly factor BamB